jgi:hypothetical protein
MSLPPREREADERAVLTVDRTIYFRGDDEVATSLGVVVSRRCFVDGPRAAFGSFVTCAASISSGFDERRAVVTSLAADGRSQAVDDPSIAVDAPSPAVAEGSFRIDIGSRSAAVGSSSVDVDGRRSDVGSRSVDDGSIAVDGACRAVDDGSPRSVVGCDRSSVDGGASVGDGGSVDGGGWRGSPSPSPSPSPNRVTLPSPP